MALSNDLARQFAKVTNNKTKTKSESTVYGTVVSYGDKLYVKVDGSDALTPVDSSVVAKPGDRITVMIKDHNAIATGNLTDPSASSGTVSGIYNQIGGTVSLDELTAIKASIGDLKAVNAELGNLEAINAAIENLEAKYADIDHVNADMVEALNADIDNLHALFAEIDDLDIEHMEAVEAYIGQLKSYNAEFTYVSAERFDAVKAEIKELDVKKLTAEQADLKYANINFGNITEAAIVKLFSESGIIEDLIVSEGKITGELVGVTIKGDLIEAGTLKADRLVVKGSDGNYYKINTDFTAMPGVEPVEEDAIHGSVLVKKSIVAEKIAVDDLVAFGATIGGFNITKSSIYSGVKTSPDNTTRGIYLDKEGQVAFGDGSNYLRYFKDQNGNYKLEISASSIMLGSSDTSIKDYLGNIENIMNDTVKSIETEYAVGDSATESPTEGWSNNTPGWTAGNYVWQRTVTTYNNGRVETSAPVCITGGTGKDGADAILLQILSSNGNMFKNTSLSTTLTVEIIIGGLRITSSRDMYLYFGGNARLIWQQKKFGETEFEDIDEDDSRISDNGFIFTLNTEDLKLQTVYNCVLDC